MDHKERFHLTAQRAPVDRPASWLGIPDPAALPGLCRYFGVRDLRGLHEAVDDDLVTVDLPYHSPVGSAIYAAFDFAKDKADARTLTCPGWFEDAQDPDAVKHFQWPDPARYIDPAQCRAQAMRAAGQGRAVMGAVWSAHFQDTCAAFGMQTALVKMLTDPDVVHAVNERIVSFYLQASEIFYEAAKGLLDAVLIGNDMGSQLGLMLSPELIRAFILPGARRLIAQAKSYGLKVLYHSCGSIALVIQDLIDAGADIIHPIQALAAGMDAQSLHQQFAGRVSFCGGVDAQHLLIHGKPDEVRREVRRLRGIFPTGLILSPSHEAVLPDAPLGNLRALFEAAHEVPAPCLR